MEAKELLGTELPVPVRQGFTHTPPMSGAVTGI